MIASAYIQQQAKRFPVVVHQLSSHKCSLHTETIPHRFVLAITFNQPIRQFRNVDYQWISFSKEGRIPEFANKILQLEDGTYVQSSTVQGIWEWFPKTPETLYWHFHPADAEALTIYSGIKNYKVRTGAQSIALKQLPDLLFSATGALELSRTPLPFVGTICFTDHCDYDTPENLKTQREFLKSKGIRVTKGFFLHHFSKRTENASWENQADELQKWVEDGHELAYHSLSQSIKTPQESYTDFIEFKAPMPSIPVWIDHGFQPYNWSMFANSDYQTSAFQRVMEQNKIAVFWNYMDTGRVSKGIINQLDSQQFTYASFQNSIKELPFLKRWENRLKNVVFYADNSDRRIRLYIDALAHFRKLITHKNPLQFAYFLRCILPVLFKLMQLQWGSKRMVSQPYPLARFTPTFFKHQFGNQVYTVFQSLEMVDFSVGLAPENIDLLRNQSGLCIAHTYFSVDMKHHQGRLLENERTVALQPAQNFDYLAQQIKEAQLWNPTLSELVAVWEKFSSVRLDIDAQGVIFVSNGFDLPVRVIS